MPTKFVQNVAKRTGTSVEHAEKVWHDAKQAVKKGKRQGSWYWGKVVNTFKRMMGIKEHISFSEFADLLESEGVKYRSGMDGWPDKIKLNGPYVLVKSPESSDYGVTWTMKEFFGEEKESPPYASVTYGRDYYMVWVARPGKGTPVSLIEKEEFENVPEDEVPEYIEKFKVWVRNVFDDYRQRGLLEALHPETIDSFNRIVLYPVENWPNPGWKGPDVGTVFGAFDEIFGDHEWYHRYNIDTKELETQIINGRKIEIYYNKKVKPKLDVMKKLGIKIDHLSDYHPEHDIDDDVNEDKKEDGVKKSYVAGLNREEKAEMKREIKRFSKMDHKDKAAYPDDWTADQKYKERLKKKGKKLPKSSHTKEFERRYGK